MRHLRYRRAVYQAAGCNSNRRRTGAYGGGRSADDGRRIPDSDCSRRSLARHGSAFDTELADAGLSVQEFLKGRNPAWNLIGRVHFNLAENRKDDAAPFAFLVTYTTRLSAQAKAQHMPLGKALQEYAGAKNRERLLSLLLPIQRAAEHCAWLKAMVDAGEIFHPLRWSPQQALQFLKDVPALESAGVAVRMPASWRLNRPARAQVKATIGGRAPSQMGMDALLDFQMEVTLDGEKLSAAEIKRLLAQSDGLVLVRGKWVEVDHERLRRTLDEFEAAERRAASDGLSFGEAMRMLAGANIAAKDSMDSRISTGARPSPAPGWRTHWRPCAVPMGLPGLTPANIFRARCGRINWLAFNGSICSLSSGSGPALPTIWGSARPSRSCHFCSCSRMRPRTGGGHVFSSPRPRCLPIGLRKLLDLRRASRRVVVHPSAAPAEKLSADERVIRMLMGWQTRIW